jgi:hypothetical protein
MLQDSETVIVFSTALADRLVIGIDLSCKG